MPVFGSNTNNAGCGCSNSGGDTPSNSLFLGNYASLEELAAQQPNPESGSYAYLTNPNGPDETAIWDVNNSIWYNTGQNNIPIVRNWFLYNTGILTSEDIANRININFFGTHNLDVLPVNSPVYILPFTMYSTPPTRYVFLFTGGKGKWGNGEGYTPVDASQFQLISTSAPTTSNIPIEDTIELGAILEGQFLQAVNSTERDFSNPDEDYYFSYTINEQLYLALFTGIPEVYGGESMYQFTESDFNSTEPIGNAPTIIPTADQVAEAGNTIYNKFLNFINGVRSLKIFGDGIDWNFEAKTRKIRFASPAESSPEEVTYTIPPKDEDDEFSMKSDTDLKLNKGPNTEFENLNDVSTIYSMFLTSRLGQVFRSAFLQWDETTKKFTIKGSQAIWEAYAAVTDGNMGIKALAGALQAFKIFDNFGNFMSFGTDNGKRLSNIFTPFRLVNGTSYNEAEYKAVECLGSVVTLLKQIEIPVNSILTIDVSNICAHNMDKNALIGFAQFSFKNDSGLIINISRDELRYGRQFSYIRTSPDYVISTDTRIDTSIAGQLVSVNFVNTVNKITNVHCEIKFNITILPEA